MVIAGVWSLGVLPAGLASPGDWRGDGRALELPRDVREARTSDASPDAEANTLGQPVDPATYQVGPGDLLRLAVGGGDLEPYNLWVDAEGGLALPDGSRVDLAGLTLTEARAAVAKALAREYRRVQFDLGLVRPRRFKVHVGGAVARPGSYLASPLTLTSEVLERAGGVLEDGSQRRVRLVGTDGSERYADLVGFAFLADRERNPAVRADDLIQVPVAVDFVAVWGGVARPGRYELRDGETIGDLVALAGGLLPEADATRIEWRHAEAGRFGAPGVVALSATDSQTLAVGDALVVPTFYDRGRLAATVEVEGEVPSPGVYPIQPGVDRARQLLEWAGGFTEAANVRGVRLLRAPEELQAVDAEDEALPIAGEAARLARRRGRQPVEVEWSESGGANPTLADGDLLVVPRLSGRVWVGGRVKQPGWVAYQPGLAVKAAIQAAGGFDRGAHRGGLLLSPVGTTGHLVSADSERLLIDGDRLWVPEKAPIGGWQVFRDVVSVAAQLATIAIIVDQVRRN